MSSRPEGIGTSWRRSSCEGGAAANAAPAGQASSTSAVTARQDPMRDASQPSVDEILLGDVSRGTDPYEMDGRWGRNRDGRHPAKS